MATDVACLMLKAYELCIIAGKARVQLFEMIFSFITRERKEYARALDGVLAHYKR